MGLIHINIEEDTKRYIKSMGLTYRQVFLRGLNALKNEQIAPENTQKEVENLKKKLERVTGLLNSYAKTVAFLEEKQQKTLAERGF